MWIASVLKTAAAISAVLFIAGITWAVESGGGGDGMSAVDANKKTNLEVAAPSAGAAKGANRPNFASAFADQLNKNAASLEDELNRIIEEKADLSAELEWQQLQKASLQRELEAVNDAFGPLKPDSNPADEATRKNVEAMEQRLAALQNEFKKSVRQIAEMTAAVDQRQRKVKRSQDLLDNIDRLRNQLDMQQILDSATASSVSSTASSPGEYRIQPQDVLTVRAIGAFADQPIGDSYFVEPMGTIALGPAYGRVKVDGLTVLEAEEAIKQKLSEVIAPENLKVQATISAQHPAVFPTATEHGRHESHDVIYTPSNIENQQVQIIKQLQHETESLRQENAKLKNEPESP